MLDRRQFVKTSLAASFGAAALGSLRPATPTRLFAAADAATAAETPRDARRRPLVLHQADLFHEHGDPDDHFDLATIYSLALQNLVDLRGLILDYPPSRRKGDPAVAAVAQMNRMSRQVVPYAVGSKAQIERRGDKAPNLSPDDSVAVDFIISTLERAEAPVRISIVGSATDVAIASSRRPELFREKCAGVYLNAGAARENPDMPGKLEFNVELNPRAYATMFDLTCPLYWYPCWTVVETRQTGENGTFYWLPHDKAFDGISDALAGFFAYMFEKTQSSLWLKAIEKRPSDEVWTKILSSRRGMWSTASLLALADKMILRDGSVVDRTPEVDASPEALYRMENIRVSCADDGRTTWEFCEEETGRQMFRVLDVPAYPGALAKAVNSLFRAFK